MKFLPVLSLLALSLSATACSPIVRTSGSMFEPETLTQLQPGVSREADVVALLGTPTTESTFDPRHEWYYVGQRTEQTAFLAPEVVDRQVLRISFDDNGVLSKVDKLTLADGQELDPNSRTTPTVGHELTMMEQILGNVGRFKPAEKK